MTFGQVQNIRVVSRPSVEFTWFPGLVFILSLKRKLFSANHELNLIILVGMPGRLANVLHAETTWVGI